MIEPTDRAVLLIQKVSELLLESLAIAQQLEVVPDGDVAPAEAGDRIAYGILVAALENGLVKTLQGAVDVLKRFNAPAGLLGEEWLGGSRTNLGGVADRDLGRAKCVNPGYVAVPITGTIRTHFPSSGTGMNSCP